MKALLRKDIYLMLTQFRALFLVMVIFSAIPGGLLVPFTFLYAMMLTSVSLMSVDEQTQWEALALMLPYSRRQLVTVKYVMGWLGIAAALVVSVMLQGLWAAAGVSELQKGFFDTMCLCTAIAGVGLALMLPVNFRFGYAKGRIMTILFAGIIGGAVGASIGDGDGFYTLLKVTSRIPAPVYPLLAAALCAATVPLSVAGYKKRVEK